MDMEIQDNLLNTTDIVYAGNLTDSPMNDTNATNMTKVGSHLTTTTAISEPNFEVIQYLPEYLAAYWLDAIYLGVLTVIGLTGNTLSICTIVRMPPLSSSSLYVLFLAITDSLSLVIKLIYQQLTNHDIRIGDAGCRVLLYLVNFLATTTSWLVVFMTTERLIAIWFPLHVSQISTKRKTCAVFAGLVMFFLCLNNVFLYMIYEASNKLRGFHCSVLPEYRHYMGYIYYWVDACFYALVPCALLVVLNSCIILGTWLAMSSTKRMTQKREQNGEKRKQQNQITVMMVTVSVIFIILTIPNAVYSLSFNDWVPTTNIEYALQLLVGRIVHFLSDCNHAVNFFLYFFSGRRFRHMFLQMIGFRSRQRNKRTYESTLNSHISGSRPTEAKSMSNISGNVEVKEI